MARPDRVTDRRRLAAVFAHPDDDSYGVGGILAMGGGDLDATIVVVTSGEAGPIADPALATPETLGRVREDEEREALRALGASHADLRFLRRPDGGLKDLPRDDLVQAIADILIEARPEVVVTFGPEGITRHDDHITVGQAATVAFHQLQATDQGSGAFRRLFYVAIPQSDLSRFWEDLRSRGIDVGDPDAPFMPRGVPDHTIAARVDCASVVERKREALRAHRTQRVEPAEIPEDLEPAVLRYECFVQAWPPVAEPGGPLLSSVFEGLEA
jgi:LmbE family N-acetylglucosaminyl deacetylase